MEKPVNRSRSLFDSPGEPAPKRAASSLFKPTEMSEVKRSLFDEKISIPHSTKVSVDQLARAPITRLYKEGTSQEYYSKHPLLVMKKEEFVTAVIDIDQAMNLSSASRIVSYGSAQQQKVGELVNQISELSGRIVALGIPDMISNVIGTLKKLEPTNFKKKEAFGLLWNRTVDCTVEDFITAFATSEKEIQNIVANIRLRVEATSELMEHCEQLIKQHKDLAEEMEQYLIAGSIIIDRNSKALFTELNTAFLTDQFEKRVCDLKSFNQMMTMALEQAKITQKNVVTQVMEACSLIDATIPIWKSSFSILLTKWQTNGVQLTTPLKNVNDPQFEKAAIENQSFIQKLQGTINGPVTV